MFGKISPFWETFKKEILTKERIFLIILLAFIYIALAVYLMNYKLVFSTISGNFSVGYKVSVLSFLLTGAVNTFSRIDFLFLITASFWSALNVVMAVVLVAHMKRHGFLRLAIGGGSILGLASTGCTGCGFSLISVLGFGAVFSFIPFGNSLLYVSSMVFLFLATYHLLRRLNKSAACQKKNL